MKYILTEFYKRFYCIGDKCSDTCCGGWRIWVDENTYQVYMGLEEPYRSEICNNIKQNQNGQYEIIKDKAGRCPFLNEKNLCNIYLNLNFFIFSHSIEKICSNTIFLQNLSKIFESKISLKFYVR